jgi:isoleucyl-tRNA synthetase
MAALGDELRFVLITSQAKMRPASERPANAVAAESVAKEGAWIAVAVDPAPKCVRCWHRRSDVGADPKHPEICGRCAGNLEEPGEARRWA